MQQRISTFFSGSNKSVLTVVGVSMLAMLCSACLLQGPKFIFVAPILLLAVFAGLYFKPPKYYLPLCIGFFLGSGLYVGLANIFEFGMSLSACVSLTIGLIGFAMVLSSLWQFMFGEWTLPAWYDKAMRGIVIFGVFVILATVIVALSKDRNKIEATTVSTEATTS